MTRLSTCSGGGSRITTNSSCGQQWSGTTAVHDQARHLTFSSDSAWQLCRDVHPSELPFMHYEIRADGNGYWTPAIDQLTAWRAGRREDATRASQSQQNTGETDSDASEVPA